MKTKEFIKYFEDEGYKTMFDDYCDKSVLFINENHELLLCVSEGDRIDTDYCAFNDLDQSKKQEYYKVIFEYLMTPLEERKEEKYYYRLKGLKNTVELYLNQGEFSKEFYLNDKDESRRMAKTQFTDKEFAALPEDIKSHNWEKIKVEREE